ncbi:MAG: tRNA (adenosine(37)-N6)-dimethylallyltransferase MiaA, partial [Bacteroidota bacterium]|nr:tRNA (adenosine(37)-N6)-dimethylallyltransferase MiaA [Bacteroidota bacterium]
MHPCLIVIMGPTAVGKTQLTIDLAKYFNSEIISSDSRQFYQEMQIGTAKPSKEELNQVKHHFINNRSVQEYYSAGDFEKEAKTLLTEMFNAGLNPVFATGGSGLYVKAICEGLDEVPSADLVLRENLILNYETHGISWLQETLLSLNPEAFSKMDTQNPQRLMRAIELFKQGGIVKKDKIQPFYKVVKIGLNRDRADLYARINDRVDNMMAQGLLEEVQSLVQFKNENALQTVGYSELFDYLEGAYNVDRAVELIKQ